MAKRTLKYCSPCLLPITNCGSVALCLSSEWVTRTSDGTGIAYGSISGNVKINKSSEDFGCPSGYTYSSYSCNNSCAYEYCIVYDDDQFEINPDTGNNWLLAQESIVSIGPSACIVQAILAAGGGGGGGGTFTLDADIGPAQSIAAGNTMLLVGGDGIETVVSAPDTVTISADISGDANNYITIGGDGGLYVPTPAVSSETPITVSDTATIDITASGAANHTLQAAVKLSGAGDNQITVDGQGLYVPPTSVSCSDINGFFFSRPNASNACITEIGLCEGTGNETIIASLDFSDYINSIQEVQAQCGRRIEFTSCGGDTFGLPISDKMLINQASHGLGASGDLVPVKINTSGVFSQAGYTGDADVAVGLAQIIDSNSFWIIAQGFHVATGHGYQVGKLHSGHSSGVVAADTLNADDYVQNLFVPFTANCIYVSVEEAQPPIHPCCNLITQASHGFSVGDVVTVSGGTWSAAVASDSPIFMVSEVVDTDNFYIILSGCLTELAGISGGTVYAVSTSSAGDLVDASTLNAETDIIHCIGSSPADSCLIVNITPCSKYRPPQA